MTDRFIIIEETIDVDVERSVVSTVTIRLAKHRGSEEGITLDGMEQKLSLCILDSVIGTHRFLLSIQGEIITIQKLYLL